MDSGWWAVGVAAVAAIFAAWQAWEARRARADALKARDDAEGHEQAALEAARSSAEAATRGAEAQERIAAVAEKQAREVTTWKLRQVGAERWAIVNATRGVLMARLLHAKEEAFLRLTTEGVYAPLGPEEGLEVLWPDRYSMPSYAQVLVDWFESPGGELQQARLTLRREDGIQLF